MDNELNNLDQPIKLIQSNRKFNTIQKEKAANPQSHTPQTLVHNTPLHFYFLQTNKDQT